MTTLTTGKATEFIQFTRASNATVTDSDGKIKWAPHNLLGNSESFSSSSWATYNATITPNVDTAPNGTSTADRFTIGGVVPSVYVLNGVGAGQHTVAFFAKAGTSSVASINVSALANGIIATFNMSTLATSVSNVGTGGTVSGGTATISSVGNGWYYCVLANVITTGTNNVGFAIEGTSGQTGLIWGAHLYRSDLGGMQANTSAYPMYNPTTPKNLLGYTEDFSNAAWTKSATTITANAVLAPNGLQTADTLLDTAATSSHYIYQSVASATVSGTNYTVRFYAKANTLNYVAAGIADISSGSLYATAVFNLATGSLATSGAVGTGYAIVGTPSINAVGDGWYLCSVTCTPGSSKSFLTVAIGANKTGVISAGSGGMENYLGNGSGIYLWGAQLSDSASLDAYSPVYGAAVTSAAYYGPRRDFDPVSLACKGLLVEEQRANLQIRSAEFAFWTKTEVTVSSSAATSPSGTLTADSILETAVNDIHRIYLVGASVTSGASYTWSGYVKANGRNIVQIVCGATAVVYTAEFDLSAVTTTNRSGTGTATITSVGNGWYRITATAAATASGSGFFQLSLCSAANTTTYLGDITKGVYFWGAQLEAGSFATSYIPVGATTAGATRSADVASVSTQAFPYSATEGTLVVSGSYVGFSSAPAPAFSSITDGSTSVTPSVSWVLLYQTSTTISALRRSNSINATAIDVTNAPTANEVRKVGTTFAVGGTDALSVNGSAVATQAGVASPYANTILRIGAWSSNPGYLNGHIRQITYLPRRISNTELQTRTS